MHFFFVFFFFFFNDTATTEIYTLSLHDALPISRGSPPRYSTTAVPRACPRSTRDRKSTRLNSSHPIISYAVFCLKKKQAKYTNQRQRRDAHLSRRRNRAQNGD